MTPLRSVDDIKYFHAHVYYDRETRDTAAGLRAAIEERFDAQLGRWHDKPVGPHPKSMYQVSFENDVFAELVPWLMLNRNGLDVLVHPNTGDDVSDHTGQALWLGEKLPLNIDVLREHQAKGT